MADELTQCAPGVTRSMELYLGVFLCIGTFISYLPQHLKIIAHKTSEGFSPLYLLLGTVSAFSNVNNIFLLQLPSVACFGILQIGTQWFMFFTIFVLYLLYFPVNQRFVRQEGTNTYQMTLEWRAARSVAVAVFGHMLVTSFFTALLTVTLAPGAWQTETWANTLGIFSMVLACFQFFPQIWKTWRRRAVGALSIPMMLIQTPGGFLFAYSIFIRPGVNWTSWITYLMSATLQGVLLAICIAWHFREKRLQQANAQLPRASDGVANESSDEPLPSQSSERTPLLAGEGVQ
ncbi:hypothetical protein H4R34_005611 [Dimargaris verticillata]|uniref:PQ loop repeat-domain-containing protein n=1 Tax=Dimargaris verticillata TaxID=2761393 RepID=A0A9W8EAK4_9FUNG|nr:hypothetical protein H4R34_005611 [Dimargaris verticillata]